MTMRERIAAGKLFTDMCEGLPEERLRGKQFQKAFNDSDPADTDKRVAMWKEMFAKGEGIWIEPPIYFCYGNHISIGKGTYINVNCNFIDDGPITIGEGCLFGPAVTIATVGHPINPNYRSFMYADGVTIGNLTHSVYSLCCVEHCLSYCSLSASAVSDEGNVSDVFSSKYSHM